MREEGFGPPAGWSASRRRPLLLASLLVALVALSTCVVVLWPSSSPDREVTASTPATAGSTAGATVEPSDPRAPEPTVEGQPSASTPEPTRKSTPSGAKPTRNATAAPAPVAAPTPMSAVTPPSEIAQAGLSDPGRLTPSDSITVVEDGATVENLDVTGSITVRANDVTIRNVRVRSDSKSYGIYVMQGQSGTHIDHVDIEMGVDGTSGNGAIGGTGDHQGAAGKSPGNNVTVRSSRIHGTADGIKAANYSLYEYNHISMRRGNGSNKHIDGIQSSGRSFWTARYNWVDQAYSAGHNSAIFAQAFTGKTNTSISGITIEHNWVNGGVFTIQTGDGKNDENGFLSDIRINDNVFFREYHHGVYEPRGDVTGNGGVWADTGQPVPSGKIKG